MAARWLVISFAISLARRPEFSLHDLEVEDLSKSSISKVSLAQDHQHLQESSFAELNEVFTSKLPACDEQLKKLKKALTKFCVKHGGGDGCQHDAASVLQHASPTSWGESMVTGGIRMKVPVFWSGFWEYDTSGMASKKNLSDFVEDVNGLLLHGGGLVEQTEWGMAVQEANDLNSCSSWERKKPFWTAASAAMAGAMHHAQKDRIVVAVRKELTGDRSIFNSILYSLELVYLGEEMRRDREWNPSFEVYEIPVTEASDCKVAPWLKTRLKVHANREVAMTCALCPRGLQACGPQRQVTAAKMTRICTAGDCQNGQGILTFADGGRYEGDFKNGKMEGKGKYFHADGDRYEGDWKNGQQDGKGKYFFANGNRYEGDYKNGQRDGKGKYFYANRDHYEGDFKNGQQDGKGKLFYADGDRYEGDYKNGQMEGKGKYFHADGDRYEGDYKNGVEDGKGKYFHADGDRYEGDYKNGVEDGKGMYFYADGDCEECVFKMGKEVRCEKLAKQSCKQL